MDIISKDLLDYAVIAKYVATDKISVPLDPNGCKVLSDSLNSESCKAIAERCKVLDETRLTAKAEISISDLLDLLDFDDESKIGIQAVCVEHNSQKSGKELIVAYRGSANTPDWVADVGIANACLTSTGAAAVRVVIERLINEKTRKNWLLYKDLVEEWGIFAVPAHQLGVRIVQSLMYFDKFVKPKASDYQRVVVVGHSLGAFLASHVAYKNNLFAYAFDGPPGVKYSLVRSVNEVDKDKANKILNHRLGSDPVSCPGWNILNLEIDPAEDNFMLDVNGFPYGHMGFIANWKQKGEIALHGWDNHALSELIKTEFDSNYLLGASQASTTSYYF